MQNGALTSQPKILNDGAQFTKYFVKLYLPLWLMLVFGLEIFVLYLDYNQAQSKFERFNGELFNHISDRTLVAEAVLEGFAAFVTSMETFNHMHARKYSNPLLKRYPYLYMFEVAECISHEGHDAFEQFMSGIYPGYYIRKFDYAVSRQWQKSPRLNFIVQ